jgi:SAM-dependent methyltransferase
MEPDVELSEPIVIEFACPICKGPLQHGSRGYFCARDQRVYHATLGIPDFRVWPDGLFESKMEQAWTERLVAKYSNASFAELVDFYASLTPAVPLDVVAKRRVHIQSAVVRAQSSLAEIEQIIALPGQGQFLEIGCGTGGFLVAATRVFRSVVGLDISMPRALLAKKQLEETGRKALVICASAEFLPFVNDSFHLVVGSDVIEHVNEHLKVMREAHRVLMPAGALFLATPNRWSLTPEPHVNLWGVGFLPKAWRAPYVRLVREISYQNINLLNWFEIRRLILKTPFDRWHIIPPTFTSEHTARLPAWTRAAVPIYHALKERLLFKWLVYLFGPLFHVICIKK